MNVFQSKTVAWLAMIVILAIIVGTFCLRVVWWAFIDELFAFLMVFCQLTALYLGKLNPLVKKKLQMVAVVCGVLTIISLIGEFIAYQIIYG